MNSVWTPASFPWAFIPLKLRGLIGILTAPLIHANLTHLFDNSIPLFFLSLALFYFYREVAYRVFFLIWFITGALVWLVGREAYHIGASGIIYGLATFLLTSGIIRRNRNLMAISLLVIFLYGSMVWGLFPYDYHISWESHMSGALTGLVLAIIYRHEGPEPDISRLEEDEEENHGPGADEENPAGEPAHRTKPMPVTNVISS